MGSGFCNRSHDGMTCVAWQLPSDPSDEDCSPFHVGFIASLLVVVFLSGTLAMRPLLITTMSSCMRATSCTDKVCRSSKSSALLFLLSMMSPLPPE